MSRRTRFPIRRFAAVASIALLGSIPVAGTASAGQGPVCEDNEEPVCEEPPPPPPTPLAPSGRGWLTVYEVVFVEFAQLSR